MPPRRRCHLAMPQETLLHDRDLVAIAPLTTARRIRGREDFNFGSELMVGHKVGLSTDAETPSDGLHRRHTIDSHSEGVDVAQGGSQGRRGLGHVSSVPYE